MICASCGNTDQLFRLALEDLEKTAEHAVIYLDPEPVCWPCARMYEDAVERIVLTRFLETELGKTVMVN